MHASQMM